MGARGGFAVTEIIRRRFTGLHTPRRATTRTVINSSTSRKGAYALSFSAIYRHSDASCDRVDYRPLSEMQDHSAFRRVSKDEKRAPTFTDEPVAREITTKLKRRRKTRTDRKPTPLLFGPVASCASGLCAANVPRAEAGYPRNIVPDYLDLYDVTFWRKPVGIEIWHGLTALVGIDRLIDQPWKGASLDRSETYPPRGTSVNTLTSEGTQLTRR
ncbi:hypothetical protein PUN28_005761 [Cardiocondyla obscurior]|uniref:Uncharacterized protein n=1 Tax=Cardiocondyla obscurior TaxID=286306 RepID=A0AAW2G8A6_9HYME